MRLLTEREWKERQRQTMFRIVRRVGYGLLVFYLLMMALMSVMWLDEPLARQVVVILAITFGVTIVVTWVVLFLITLRSVRTGPVVGLYERGVQMAQFLFIPYEEIASAEVRPWGLWPSKRVVVRLRMRYKPRGWARFTTPTMFQVPIETLTEEGVEELDRRVRGVSPEETPPRLVLYGP
jgi:hypothetical protein